MQGLLSLTLAESFELSSGGNGSSSAVPADDEVTSRSLAKLKLEETQISSVRRSSCIVTEDPMEEDVEEGFCHPLEQFSGSS